MERHLYLSKENAEEILPDVVSLIKEKVYRESRSKAFDDCTLYWTERIEEIINSNESDAMKIEKICKTFSIQDEI